MEYIYRILDCHKFSILYLTKSWDNDEDITPSPLKSYQRDTVINLPRSLDVESASTLLIKLMDLQGESLSTEDRQTSVQIAQVCD